MRRRSSTRAEALAAGQLITKSDLDAARIAVDQAQPDVKAAQSVSCRRPPSSTRRRSISSTPSSARRSTAWCVERDVDVGQTVAASIQSPVLFRIATDLKKMQVQVQVDESDVAAVATGNTATFEVGSYPEDFPRRRLASCGCNPSSSSLEGLRQPARPPPRPPRPIQRRARPARARRRVSHRPLPRAASSVTPRSSMWPTGTKDCVRA